jgi:hypothetical protein
MMTKTKHAVPVLAQMAPQPSFDPLAQPDLLGALTGRPDQAPPAGALGGWTSFDNDAFSERARSSQPATPESARWPRREHSLAAAPDQAAERGESPTAAADPQGAALCLGRLLCCTPHAALGAVRPL